MAQTWRLGRSASNSLCSVRAERVGWTPQKSAPSSLSGSCFVALSTPIAHEHTLAPHVLIVACLHGAPPFRNAAAAFKQQRAHTCVWVTARFDNPRPGVFHSMRERDASHRVTRANQMWTLFLLCVDAIQVP